MVNKEIFFRSRIIRRGFWFPRSPDVNPYKRFSLVGYVKV